MQRQFSAAGETFRVRRSHLYVFASGFSKRTGRGRFRGFASTVFRSGVHPYTIPASKGYLPSQSLPRLDNFKTPPKKPRRFLRRFVDHMEMLLVPSCQAQAF